MISKELLREALGMYATPYDITQKDNKILFTWDNSSGSANSDMSICELAQLCKEWAFLKDYNVISLIVDNKGSVMCGKKHLHITELKRFYANTEAEAIFKATQYILEKIKDA